MKRNSIEGTLHIDDYTINVSTADNGDIVVDFKGQKFTFPDGNTFVDWLESFLH